MNGIVQIIIFVLAWIFLWIGQVSAQPANPSFDKVFTEYNFVMLLIDPHQGQIIDANPAAVRFYGYSKKILKTMTIQQINTFTPEQVATERKLAANIGRNYFIFRHRLSTGEIRTVEVYSQPFDFGNEKLLLSLINDITKDRNQSQDLWHYQQLLEEKLDNQIKEIERVKFQQIILLIVAIVLQAIAIVWLAIGIYRQRQLKNERETLLVTLQARNQELARLGEVMAHHFQEPARRLASFAKRLLSKSSLAADADSRQSLYFIDTQAQRLSELVRDAQRYLALDHVKLATGGPTDSAVALRYVIAAAGEMAADARIVALEPLPRVKLAEKYVCELFAILLDNALRYRHPDRPLYIEISATIKKNWAVFRFTDNGSGIAPEYRKQVFGLFTRLVPNSIPGTGMGLALAYKMVGLTGSDFHIEDGINGGVCIVFNLPLALQ